MRMLFLPRTLSVCLTAAAASTARTIKAIAVAGTIVTAKTVTPPAAIPAATAAATAAKTAATTIRLTWPLELAGQPAPPVALLPLPRASPTPSEVRRQTPGVLFPSRAVPLAHDDRAPRVRVPVEEAGAEAVLVILVASEVGAGGAVLLQHQLSEIRKEIII